MNKIAVIYWSGTGNTEKMANLVVEGARLAEAEVELFSASDFNKEKIEEYSAIALGCPSMGAEQLEDSEFEPMFDSIKSSLKDKSIGLFGSYGWGDGEWMRTWQDDCESLGAKLADDAIICNGEPDSDISDDLKNLGKTLAK